MDEMQSIAKRIETNQDDLDAWQRLGELVVEPGKKNDCRDQVTRIKNKRFGVNAVIRCEQCGASMIVLSKNESGHEMAICPVCHRTRVLAGDLKQVGDAAKTSSFSEENSTPANVLKGRLTLVAIIGSNLLPFFGILFMGWSMFSVMILYWIENIIVGFFTVLKLALAEAQTGGGMDKPGMIAFFCVHFGIFCTVHGVFVMAIFYPTLPRTWQALTILDELALPILLIFASHAISFFQNYLRGGIYKFAQLTTLMGEPYLRIVPMHIGLILGVYLTMMLGSPIGIILVLIALKTGAEVWAYLNSMARWRAQAGVGA
jgi:hypothetical protein